MDDFNIDGIRYTQRRPGESKQIAIDTLINADEFIVGVLREVNGQSCIQVEISELSRGSATIIINAIIRHIKHVTVEEN
jgi:hypothetical protein